MEKEAKAAADKAEAWRRAAAASAEVANEREKSYQEAVRGSLSGSPTRGNVEEREHRLRRMKVLVRAAAFGKMLQS